MSSVSSASARALFQHHPFLFYFAARGLSKFCFQVGAVAVGWQVYALTDSAAALGLVGLVQFIPPQFWSSPRAMLPIATIDGA